MKKTIEDGGGKFIDADANLKNVQQLTDVDNLINQGAKVLVILAQDNKAILPAVQKAKDANIPVIAYDRLIEDPSGSVLYMTFDNTAVGKAEADAIIAKVPKGNYVLIKGDPGDAMHVIASGRAKIWRRCRADQQELRVSAAQWPGRRRSQPEQPRVGQAIR